LDSLERRLMLAAGDLDPSVSVDGQAVTTFDGFSAAAASAVVVQSDGKIVIAGSASASTSNRDFAVARYNPDGTLDRSFGAGTGRVA
jgi:uncharacterized delta-60 repeat protein